MSYKFSHFSFAIEKYNTIAWYTKFEFLISIIVIFAQILSLLNLLQTYYFTGIYNVLFALIVSYIVTDFINGFVHMIIDNNTKFTSIVGPFIAAFHVHHYKVKYKEKGALKIYFDESGHKFWLVIYLILLIFAQQFFLLSPNTNLGLVAFGIFSSIAELSHYWCHKQKNNRLIKFLQEHNILLSLQHHRLHHIKDNINYAFLNGVSDPLLNVIARLFYSGYKNSSDVYVAAYFNKLKSQSKDTTL